MALPGNLSQASFPPLSAARATSPPVNNWKDLLLAQNEKSKAVSLSFIPPESSEVCFSEDDLSEGRNEWNLSLVGHAIGKRPYYGSLLNAVKRRWRFKGSMDLLTLEGDFFLFKFSCQEDYDLVWDNGPCFLNGRPFIFQKWEWNFRPTKEQIKELPLWIKLPNFPLCCWNDLGFSKVASQIGIPLAVDNLTATKARITFARICVQVNTASILPDSIPINLNGLKFNQEVVYDWKPAACSKCQTFSHDEKSCPLNPTPSTAARGRSKSRRPYRRDTRVQNNTQLDTIPIDESTVSRSGNEELRLLEVTENTNPQQITTDLNHSPIQSPVLETETYHEEITTNLGESDVIDIPKEAQSEIHICEESTAYETNTVKIRDIALSEQSNRSTENSTASLESLDPQGKASLIPGKSIYLLDNAKEKVIPTPTATKGKQKKGRKPATSSSS